MLDFTDLHRPAQDPSREDILAACRLHREARITRLAERAVARAQAAA
ncbi:MAG: hypothetical protein AAF914_01510 [Pseudomonadota bacterium]